ncbi:sporulation phosphorelay system protein KapB [Staphylococcus capitis]|uniref:sporulation phosphorelay system protein KapB n=1 Tax=Staphylococcus capitis TaxID=29388 RepID=UPI000D1C16A4|nr:sporulation phosphorelay system protein KapB [Staphylococcus capitis]MBF2260909.1 kinase [Staphylococcus capitis]MBF2281167.1 kinase [Staphylococcus capitis]MCC3755224.1 kinase-associated lipoprotein B [Staphylococcus capitis]MDH8729922.1 sporulation phosphorelay system protein KapB [Staphylococcus capitis]MDH8921951.1 sporulation phosphorelay system protein KapB [Staphylococcus capitis]
MLYRFSHKTGSYGVTIREENDDQVLVQVEQVIKHPKQGDLHNPNETKGVFFHERKALSHFEKRYAKRSQLREFNVEEMNYEDSLQQAITDLEHQLKEDDSEHARLSLKNLNELKEDYSIQYKREFV